MNRYFQGITYFNGFSYELYNMDLLMAEHIQRRLHKNNTELIINPIHKPTVEIYKSPKRDNMCPHCGQQFIWCTCHLKDK